MRRHEDFFLLLPNSNFRMGTYCTGDPKYNFPLFLLQWPNGRDEKWAVVGNYLLSQKSFPPDMFFSFSKPDIF